MKDNKDGLSPRQQIRRYIGHDFRGMQSLLMYTMLCQVKFFADSAVDLGCGEGYVTSLYNIISLRFDQLIALI